MKIIETLSGLIEEELQDADKYAQLALTHRADYPELAETFSKLSGEEMQHMNMLHNQAAKIIEKYRRENGEPPAPMAAVYDYLHRKQIKKSAEVKAKQLLYNEQAG